MNVKLMEYASRKGFSQSGDYVRTRVLFLLFAGLTGTVFYVVLGPVLAMIVGFFLAPFGAAFARKGKRIATIKWMNALLGVVSLILAALAFSGILNKCAWVAIVLAHAVVLGVLESFLGPADTLVSFHLAENAENREAANARATFVSWAARTLILLLFAAGAWLCGSMEKAAGPTVVGAALAFDALSFFVLAKYLWRRNEDGPGEKNDQALTMIELWTQGYDVVKKDGRIAWFLVLQALVFTCAYQSGAFSIAYFKREVGMSEWLILLLFAGAAVSGAMAVPLIKTNPWTLWLSSIIAILSNLPSAFWPTVPVIGSFAVISGAVIAALVKMSQHIIQGSPEAGKVRAAWTVMSMGLGNSLVAVLHGFVALDVATNRTMIVWIAVTGSLLIALTWRLSYTGVNELIRNASRTEAK